MKTQIKIIYFFLISFSIEKIVIQSASTPTCYSTTTTFSIEGYSTQKLFDIYTFNFSISGEKEGEKYNYNVKCYIPTNNTEPEPEPEPDKNSTTSDSISDYPSETVETSYIDSDSTEIPSQNFLIRLLQDNYPIIGTCKIENVTKSITFKESTIEKSEDINIDATINLNFDECYEEEENIETKIIISFRQLSGFVNKKNTITFFFYGMITGNLPLGYLIEIQVNLINNGKKEKNTRIANCFLNNEVRVVNNIPVQGDFKCTIDYVSEDINSFEYYSSTYITGIPEDINLLNPITTEKYIENNKIANYTKEENKNKIIPNFYSESINSANCKENGKFTIEGKLNTDLSDDLNFEFPLANPKNIVVTCSLKSGKKNEKKEIICETNEKINNEEIIIAQTNILNKKKEIVLIINKINENKKTNCLNGIVNTITTKIDIPIPITFRQVNQFISLKNKATFHFIGIVNQFMPYGRKMKILVLVYSNGIKEQNEANCVLNKYTPFNSFNQNYGQVDFYCEANSKNNPLDLEIISSDDILGINDDDLEDYQKSPSKTDKKIKETENQTNLGKVLNYTSNEIVYDIPPVLTITNIKIENCKKKGILRLEANFNKKIEQKFDFTIPLSYPYSSIKCTVPEINANVKVNLDCKVQNDFKINDESIVIEPRIIKKKNQEVIYVKKFVQKFKDETCNNYNTIRQEYEQNSHYTFLQTNNFNLQKGKIHFKIFICPKPSHIGNIETKIKITIIVKKKSYLRYLDELQEPEPEPEEIACSSDKDITDEATNEDTIIPYNCISEKITVNNENEIGSFQIESDNIAGLHEENTNPIETDNDIKNNKAINFDEKSSLSEIPTFYPEIDTQTDISTESCLNDGIFYINGTGNLKNNPNFKYKPNFEIVFSEPFDSSSICNFTSEDYDRMECQNKEEFKNKEIKISSQSVGQFLLKETNNKDTYYFTCSISPLSNQKIDSTSAIIENNEEGNITQSSVINSYFSKKISSSGGLSGGTIAAIVICSAVILIAVGILITLIKKGVLIPPKSEYPTSYGSTVPEINNSSVDII